MNKFKILAVAGFGSLALGGALGGCSASEPMTPEQLIERGRDLLAENIAKEEQNATIREQERQAAIEEQDGPDLLDLGISLFNRFSGNEQASPPNSTTTSGGIEVQSLNTSGGGNASNGGGSGVSPSVDPYTTGGITFHDQSFAPQTAPAPLPQNNGYGAYAPTVQPTGQHRQPGAGQRPTAGASQSAGTSTNNSGIGGLFEGWVSQVTSGLLGQPAASQQSVPAYSPPMRQMTLQSFDGSSMGARRLIDGVGASNNRAAQGFPIPPVAFEALPDDMSGSAPGNKDLFFSIMIPIALLVNEQIQAERQAIIATGYQGDIASAPMIVQQIAGRYEVEGSVSTLLTHVDTLPISLMLAQAIEESGWGTSRFAQEGNALFGQYTWNASDKGMVPGGRPAGESYRIKAFDTLFDAVRSYALNLNRHSAYAELRAARLAARNSGRTPSGRDLVRGLAQYSGDPGYYIPAIQRHLDTNGLSRYDRATLAQGPMISVRGASAPASQ